VVLRVLPDSAAAAAGLKGARIARDGTIVPGDIIVAVEGKPVDSVGKLLGRLDDFKVGEVVRLTLLRGGAKVDARVTLQPGV
jgi:S1-C subfamily serine protease